MRSEAHPPYTAALSPSWRVYVREEAIRTEAIAIRPGGRLCRYRDVHALAGPLSTPRTSSEGPLPEYRGNGLQRKLVRIGERRAFADGYREGYATVSPKNKYSLDNMLALGYSVVCEAAKYGSMRLILHKRMSSPTTPSRQAFRFRGATVPCIRDARPPEMPAYGHVPTA